MNSYENIGLDNLLNPLQSPVGFSGTITPFEFDSTFDRSTITNSFLQDNSITNAKIVSLTADKISAGTIDASLITVTNINASNITTGTLNAGSVGVINLNASNITTGTLSANFITGGTLQAGTVVIRSLDGVTNSSGVTVIDGNKITTGTINASLVTVTNIDADKITVGELDASNVPIENLDGVTNATGVTVINGGKITTGTINASLVTVTNIDASNINTGTLTGRVVRTSSSGQRVEISTSDYIQLISSNGNTQGRIYGSDTGLIIKSDGFGGTGFVSISGNDTPLGVSITGGVGIDSLFSGSGSFTSDVDMNSNNITACTWVGESSSKRINFNESGRIQVNDDLDPNDAGNKNLGGSTRYWNDVSYKTLTDRGCLGWFDEGVELADGRKVADTEALLSIKMHPTKTTVYGSPMLDYKSLPKVCYVPAKDKEGNILPRDENDEPYALDWAPDGSFRGRIPAADGAETTSLISIMLGAIKELTLRIKDLETKNVHNSPTINIS